jgi:hypothetical protein
MKNALSALLPLMLLCAGSMLLTALAAWTADTAAAPRRALPEAATVTVASLAPATVADGLRLARPAGQGPLQPESK